ncbi:MAG TPA: CoA pyrophosphatase [Saprospiraceae bacterium]|nr:CoA pyrophosphatase [Saprospiraceae bacterium]
MYEFIQSLKEALKQPLPGREAQFRMAHVGRRAYMEAPADARKAGVLVLLFPEKDDWHVALMERSSHNPNDRHGGQISFPGGSFDPENDPSLLHTALREAHEEMGIEPKEAEVLGALTDLYIPVSNFHVFPFVACLRAAPVFVPQEEEVSAILTAPISFFTDEKSIQITELVLGGNFVLKDVPCFMVEGRVMWGATAMIMSELTAVFAGLPSNHSMEQRSV